MNWECRELLQITTQTFSVLSPSYYDAYVKVDNLLEYLDRSHFSKQHMNLLTEHVYAVSEAVSKYFEYLDNQVTRTTKVQNNRLIEA